MVDDSGRVKALSLWDTLSGLVAVGSDVYIRLNSQSGEALRGRLPSSYSEFSLLAARLNVPPTAEAEDGKLYVTFLVRATRARAEMSELAGQTVAVDPWEVALQPLADQAPVPHLTPARR